MGIRRAFPCAVLAALLAGCAQLDRTAAGAGAVSEDRMVNRADLDGALLARAIFEETNRVRAEHRVRPLKRLPGLDSAADYQAAHMALLLRAGHDNPFPGEHTSAERIKSAGLDPSHVGENVIMVPARRPAGSPARDFTYSTLASLIVGYWMDSPAHRANLLDPDFAYVGLGVRAAHVFPGDDRVFAAQDFCQLAAASTRVE